MKLIKKKSFLLLLLTALLLTFGILPATTAKAEMGTVRDTSKVQLYLNDITHAYRGATHNTIYIKVNKAVKNRTVLVNYTYSQDGLWNIAYATFVKSLDDNYSIYKADLGGRGDLKYSITIQNNTEKYIDDNNGNYYTNATLLGNANVAAIRSTSGLGTSSYCISAVVKNLAYNKDVKVRYTLDNWKTFKEAPLKYSSQLNNDSEVWSTYIDTSKTDFDNFYYSISYTVNGVTYWDNNFGNNYNANHYNEY